MLMMMMMMIMMIPSNRPGSVISCRHARHEGDVMTPARGKSATLLARVFTYPHGSLAQFPGVQAVSFGF